MVAIRNSDAFRVQTNNAQNRSRDTLNSNNQNFRNYQDKQTKDQQNAISKQADQKIKEYANVLKKQQQNDRDIESTKVRLQNLGGGVDNEEVRNAQTYLQLLERQKVELQARLPIYNAEKRISWNSINR